MTYCAKVVSHGRYRSSAAPLIGLTKPVADVFSHGLSEKPAPSEAETCGRDLRAFSGGLLTRFRFIRLADKVATRFAGLRIFGGHMLQNLIKEVYFRTRTDLMLTWIGAIGLAIAVGIAYFFAAQLSLALLAKPDGVALSGPLRACPPAS